MKVMFRWEIKQTGQQSVEVIIPQGEEPVIDSNFANKLKLSESEYLRAEEAALRELVIIR